MVEETVIFPIVGIGASAGGLQALKQFFEHMPVDTGMAFMIVTHLPMGRESDMPDIVGRYTTMLTRVATANQAVVPDHVYVCPPDHIMTVEGGHMRLKAREDAIQRKPIDVFLSSLANDRGEAAIGVLLSGSGNDGTLGIKAIKERGGVTFAQIGDGHGPQHSEMPGAAIASGFIDFAVPAEEMGARLADLARAFEESAASGEKQSGEEFEEPQKAICQILLKQVGHDFSGYKQRTFQRRVTRRMQVLQIDSIARYVDCLRQDGGEVNNLFRDLLIGVTNFFRDPEAFEVLDRLVIPKLLEGKGDRKSTRLNSSH